MKRIWLYSGQCDLVERRKIMYKNIWKCNYNDIKGDMKEQWGIIRDDEFSEFDGKLEKLSDLLQEDGHFDFNPEEDSLFFE
jgi:uncharacterized protein YjbJ (UPF0337 family)